MCLFSFRLLIIAWGMVLATGDWAFCPKMVLPNSPDLYPQVARCPMTTCHFARGGYLIRTSEVSSSGLAGGSVLTGIGWNYTIGPGAPGLGSLVVYLQNTPDTANAKSTDWATAISGMTAVHNAPTKLPSGAGPFIIPFTGGSPFTYTGGGIYVAFDWQYGGTLAPLVKIPISSVQVGDMLQEQSDTAAPGTMDTGGSDVRPETQLFVGPSGTDAGWWPSTRWVPCLPRWPSALQNNRSRASNRDAQTRAIRRIAATFLIPGTMDGTFRRCLSEPRTPREISPFHVYSHDRGESGVPAS